MKVNEKVLKFIFIVWMATLFTGS